MAAGAFYVIYVDRDPKFSYKDVEERIDLSRDWFRINTRLWVVYSTSDSEKWYRRLRRFGGEAGSIFICKLDISDRQGWMTQDFWDWFHQHEK
jgi:hypothetical protein